MLGYRVHNEEKSLSRATNLLVLRIHVEGQYRSQISFSNIALFVEVLRQSRNSWAGGGGRGATIYPSRKILTETTIQYDSLQICFGPGAAQSRAFLVEPEPK